MVFNFCFLSAANKNEEKMALLNFFYFFNSFLYTFKKKYLDTVPDDEYLVTYLLNKKWYGNVNDLLFWDTKMFSLIEFFFIFLLVGTIIYCVFLLFLRETFFNFFQFSVIFYSFFLFLLSFSFFYNYNANMYPSNSFFWLVAELPLKHPELDEWPEDINDVVCIFSFFWLLGDNSTVTSILNEEGNECFSCLIEAQWDRWGLCWDTHDERWADSTKELNYQYYLFDATYFNYWVLDFYSLFNLTNQNNYFLFNTQKLFTLLPSIKSFSFLFSFDSISLLFICLTTLITFLCVCICWYSYPRSNYFFIVGLLFITQLFLILAFSTINLLFFYIVFESVLIPLFFLVGMFGSRNRRIKAAYYLMFYTLFGSIPFLMGIFYIWAKTGYTNLFIIEPFLHGTFSQTEITLLWFLFLPGFAFKVPLYPFHLWLPEAHVEAPTVGSVILAGLVLKLGGYGFLRFLIGLFYWGGINYNYIIQWFCLFSMICAVLTAACQIDLKRIIAYGSIGHMALVSICLFCGTTVGFEAGVLMMLGHGFVSSALFVLIGCLYERFHSRNIRYYGGLYTALPKLGGFFFIFILLDIGIPGSPAFIAEILAFLAVVQESILLSIIMSIAILFSVGVMLVVCSRLLFGLNESRYIVSVDTILLNFVYWNNLQKNELNRQIYRNNQANITSRLFNISDLLVNEIFVLVLFLIGACSIGFWPNFFLIRSLYDLENILNLPMWLM